MKLLQNKAFTFGNTSGFLPAIILITACFALWGFANNVTTPMMGVFSKIFRISTTESTLIPVVSNLAYFLIAFPAALFMQRFSFKWGVIVGLALYALGTLLFLPARFIGAFYPFLMSYFVMTCGLSFLETSCNPYIYCMGPEQTGIQRLNTAQAFNALGAAAGMFLATVVHTQMNAMDSVERSRLPLQQFNVIKDHDLGVLIQPYFYIGAVVVLVMVVIWLTRMPHIDTADSKKDFMTVVSELVQRENYREGVLAEFFYVGAQVACWTFIFQYGSRIFIAEGMSEQNAELTAQKFNIVALCFFAAGRFICTWLMQWFSPERMLSTMAIIGMVALFGTITFTDRNGIYCLVAVSICLSLMFPTIYGLALRGIGENIKIAGAGLIMAILGGAFFPPIQAAVIQSEKSLFGLPATNLSYLIPLICLAMVAWYGHRAYVRHSIRGTEE
jgi:FHS family L-fucose permease-like MFS transporter